MSMSLTKFAQAALLLLAGLAAIPSAPAQTYKVLYSFTGGTDGALPFGGVTLDSTGNLYGTTKGDGAGTTQGSVFKLSPKGRFTLLPNFGSGGAGGGSPYAGLVRDSASNLYGTTSPNVFKLDPAGNLTVIHTFTYGTDGGLPYAGLTMDSAGNLYGTASHGGNLNDCDGEGCGVVFKITP
jgi:uncharacterized repeat protein (TIGR03803 family)